MRASRLTIFAAALAAAGLAACGNDFEEQSQITRLRVLGVQAEPAELILRDGGPLPSTTFTQLAIDPAGGAIVTVFSLCYQQGQLPAANLDCPGDAGLQLPDAGPLSARFDLNDPAIEAVAISLEDSYDGGVPGDGGISSLLAAGVPIEIGFSADAPAFENPDGGPPPTAGYADQHLLGFTQITLRTEDPARPINQNPQLSDIEINQQPLASDGTSLLHGDIQVEIDPVPASDAKETLPDGGVESLDYSFYSTAGSLSALRSTDTTATGQPGIISVDYTTPSMSGPVRLWVVVRDGRGGVGWLERDFTIVE